MIGKSDRHRNYKPRTLDGQMGFFAAAWCDLFAAIFDTFPFRTAKNYGAYLRVRASTTRIHWYYQENQ